MFPNQIDKLLQPFNVHFAFTKHILHKKTQMHDSQYSTNDKPKYSKNKMQVNYTKKILSSICKMGSVMCKCNILPTKAKFAWLLVRGEARGGEKRPGLPQCKFLYHWYWYIIYWEPWIHIYFYTIFFNCCNHLQNWPPSYINLGFATAVSNYRLWMYFVELKVKLTFDTMEATSITENM